MKLKAKANPKFEIHSAFEIYFELVSAFGEPYIESEIDKDKFEIAL